MKFFGTIRKLNDAQKFKAFIKRCRKPEWVVYCKPPFGGPEQVLDYPGRYTHRVAVSNHRLVGLHEGKVTFRWRDYKNGNKLKTMTLGAPEFIRRFLLHVLPRGFVRIRHYGFLANPRREQNLSLCRQLLDVKQDLTPEPLPPQNWMQRYERLTGESEARLYELVGISYCRMDAGRRLDNERTITYPLLL
jgi:hypothetical protein